MPASVNEGRPVANRLPWKREILICVVFLLVGLVGLPVSIYFVGLKVIGPYAPDQGVIDLMRTIWTDLAAPRLGAWLLVLSPYLVIQLLRLTVRAWRPAHRERTGKT
jgi:hypothetical protein